MLLDISIVVPAHNEEENLPSLIEDLIKLIDENKLNSEIVLVDDNSTDKTGNIIDSYASKFSNIKSIHRKTEERGMGFALIEGTKKANGEIIVWTMADRSDNLDTVPKLIKKINDGYDLVVASRYMEGGSRGDLSVDKAFFSSSYTKVTRLFFGIPIHDITNAFRAFRKKIFESIRLESGDFAISPEFAIKAQLKGFKLGEVPTTYYNRKLGRTKFKMFKMGIRYISLLKYGLMKNG